MSPVHPWVLLSNNDTNQTNSYLLQILDGQFKVNTFLKYWCLQICDYPHFPIIQAIKNI